MTLTKSGKRGIDSDDLAGLRDLLVEERQRVERLLRRVEDVLRQRQPKKAAASVNQEAEDIPAARPSPLDNVKSALAATKDLRMRSGNLSAARVAKLYGISLSQLAAW